MDILNDLLGFEKMESGQMTLHTSTEPVLPFVGECLAMFVVHARSKGIDLTADTDAGDGSDAARGSSAGDSVESDLGRERARGSGHTRALATSDLITIDKFKVAQVIRNLVSNAVKFTPRGGTVRIRAYVQRGGGDDDDAGGDAQAPVRPHPAALLAAAIKYLGAGTGDGSGSVRVSARVQAPATVSSPAPLSVPALPLPTHPLPHTGGSAGAGAGMETLLGPLAYSTDDIEAAPPLASSGGCGGGFLVIEVTDSGAGISKENQDKLFREVRTTRVTQRVLFVALWVHVSLSEWIFTSFCGRASHQIFIFIPPFYLRACLPPTSPLSEGRSIQPTPPPGGGRVGPGPVDQQRHR